MKHTKQGFSLAEIIVVTAILMVLAGLVFVLMGPQLERKKIETRARADMRQIVAAIHIYRADYDDKLPPRKEVLPDIVPQKMAPLSESYVASIKPHGANSYYYTMPYQVQAYNDSKWAVNRFDPNSNPIVVALMVVKGPFIRERTLINWDGTTSPNMKRIEHDHLAMRLDGSVFWLEGGMDPLSLEFAARSHLLRGIK